MELYHEFSVYGGYTTTVYLKRNMAGGEKKRANEIERERLRRMEERMHGPVDPARFLGMDSNIQGTEGPGLAFEKYVDDNGNLSQQGIMNAMGRANPSVEVKPDYFEKTLGHAILKELKEDEDYIHYIA